MLIIIIIIIMYFISYRDAELQRQQEWEKQRLQELMNVRQRQQENLLSLKAKNQSLSIELTTKV